jgi:hypothetical protein
MMCALTLLFKTFLKPRIDSFALQTRNEFTLGSFSLVQFTQMLRLVLLNLVYSHAYFRQSHLTQLQVVGH